MNIKSTLEEIDALVDNLITCKDFATTDEIREVGKTSSKLDMFIQEKRLTKDGE